LRPGKFPKRPMKIAIPHAPSPTPKFTSNGSAQNWSWLSWTWLLSGQRKQNG
jgi:hypothetical protein